VTPDDYGSERDQSENCEQDALPGEHAPCRPGVTDVDDVEKIPNYGDRAVAFAVGRERKMGDDRQFGQLIGDQHGSGDDEQSAVSQQPT